MAANVDWQILVLCVYLCGVLIKSLSGAEAAAEGGEQCITITDKWGRDVNVNNTVHILKGKHGFEFFFLFLSFFLKKEIFIKRNKF